jgi:hypothetical protein
MFRGLPLGVKAEDLDDHVDQVLGSQAVVLLRQGWAETFLPAARHNVMNSSVATKHRVR